MSELAKQLGLLAIVIIVLALVLVLFGAWPSNNQTVLPKNTPPPITASEQEQMQQMPVFQYLVSYTDGGFQPTTLTVKKGDVVRFTNNSSQSLWVASVGEGSDQVYPGASSCGSSPFDSCEALNPGDFWEFTFDQPGTWEFQNNLDKTKSGTLTVAVQ